MFFLNSIIINIVQNVTKKKNVHLGCRGFFYTRQAEADNYVYRCSSPSAPFTAAALSPSSVSLECLNMQPSHPPRSPPPSSVRPAGRVGPTQTGFKIDLYIFIYAYIKRGGGEKLSQRRVGGEERKDYP